MASIAQLDLVAAGAFAYGLLYPDVGTAGNSQQPSQSDDGQAPLNSDSTSKAAGKSKDAAGKKTRA